MAFADRQTPDNGPDPGGLDGLAAPGRRQDPILTTVSRLLETGLIHSERAWPGGPLKYSVTLFGSECLASLRKPAEFERLLADDRTGIIFEEIAAAPVIAASILSRRTGFPEAGIADGAEKLIAAGMARAISPAGAGSDGMIYHATPRGISEQRIFMQMPEQERVLASDTARAVLKFVALNDGARMEEIRKGQTY